MKPDQITALKIEGISVSYQEKQVLDQLSLMIGQNEIVCLLGQSGSAQNDSIKSNSWPTTA